MAVAGAGTVGRMRVCARSDCSSPAAAILTYDRVSLTAYLFSVDDPSKRTPGDLCERHVARLVLPRTWALDDRREKAATADAPALDAAPAEAAASKPAAPKKKRSAKPKLRAVPSAAPAAPRRKWAEVEPSLFDGPANDVAAPTEATPVEEEADSSEPVWMPRFGPDTELEDVLDAKTPLLRRAFGGS
jgi:hypothetical protein